MEGADLAEVGGHHEEGDLHGLGGDSTDASALEVGEAFVCAVLVDSRDSSAWLCGAGPGMLVGMYRRRWGRVDVGAPGVALTALAGEWLAHTVAYMRRWGAQRAFGSVHVFMGPVGLVLALAAGVGVHTTIRLGRRLERRLAELRLGDGKRTPSPPAQTWTVPTLIALVGMTQLGLYVLQENLEAGAAGRQVPGVSVLLGHHAVTLVIQLVVALAMVGVLWLTRREVTRLTEDIWVAGTRVQFVRRRESALLPATPARVFTPAERWGIQLWSRPPPTPRVI